MEKRKSSGAQEGQIKAKKSKKKKPIWTTATIAASLGREELLGATFKEIIFHLTSLVFLTLFIFNQTNDSEYYLVASLKSAFDAEGDLAGVASAEDFWKYMKKQMMEVFYEDPNGDEDDKGGIEEDPQDTKELENSTNSSDSQSFLARLVDLSAWDSALLINDENIVLGVPRIRQVKVTNTSCEIHGYFRRLFASCYYQFGSQSEDRQTFGLGNSTAWAFSDAKKTKSHRYWGTLTSYSGGGFYIDFPTSYNESMELLSELQDNLWITRGTRAVFMDFSIYNANLNLFCVCKLIFEFPPSGGVAPKFRFTPSTLTPFPTKWNWTMRIMLYIFCVYVLYCLCEEIREMVYFGLEYFSQFWNYVDICVILLTCLLVAGTEYMRATIASHIEEIQGHPNSYGNLETPRIIDQAIKISGATLLFFVYLRTFKYLNFNRRMAQLNNTISNCSKDILGFSVMFFVAYFAYAELGYLVFGSEVDDFRSFGHAMFALLRTILGDFDYSKIHAANWLVAPIYFLSYIILVFFVLLNMFLAIINDTYADVKTDMAIAPNELEMSEYIARKYRNVLRRLGCRVKDEEEKQHVINANVKQIREALLRCDYEEREIAMYFTRYDIDPLKELTKEDVERFYDMLAKEDLARQKGEDLVVTWKDFQRQDNKLVELENSLVMLGEKVHELLQAIRGTQEAGTKPLM